MKLEKSISISCIIAYPLINEKTETITSHPKTAVNVKYNVVIIARIYPVNIKYPSHSKEPKARNNMLYAGKKSVSGTGSGRVNKSEQNPITAALNWSVLDPLHKTRNRGFINFSMRPIIGIIPFKIFSRLFFDIL